MAEMVNSGGPEDGSRKIDGLRDATPIDAVLYSDETIIRLLQAHQDQLMERLETWLAGIERPAPSQPKNTAPTLPGSRSFSFITLDSEDIVSPHHSTAARVRSARDEGTLSYTECAARERATWQGALRWRVFSTPFELMVSIFILVNSAVIAFEVDWEGRFEEPAPWQFSIASAVFAFFFLVEVLLRIAAEGPKHFFIVKESILLFPSHTSRSRFWNWFDTFLVITSIAELITAFGTGGTNRMGSVSRPVRMIRFFRLLRVARLVGLIRFVNVVPFIRDARLLMLSIVSTLSACVWALALLIAMVYLIGVIFTEAVNDYFLRSESLDCRPESELDDDVCLSLKKYWGNIPKAMLTLFEAIFSGIDWSVAARPLRQVSLAWTILFLTFIAFVYMVILNTVTGAFVHSAIESVQRNREWLVDQLLSTKRQFADSIQDQFFAMFDHVDDDKSGTLTLEELERHLQEPQVKAYFALLDLEARDLHTLFRLLDRDGSKEVDVATFVEWSVRLKGQARAIDLAKLQADTKARLARFSHFLVHVDAKMDACLRAARVSARADVHLDREEGLSPSTLPRKVHTPSRWVPMGHEETGEAQQQGHRQQQLSEQPRAARPGLGPLQAESPEPSSCPPQRGLTGQRSDPDPQESAHMAHGAGAVEANSRAPCGVVTEMGSETKSCL